MRGLAHASDYAWNYTTTNQCGLDKSKKFPIGRGVGGGAAINGMFWTRPDAQDFNAWSTLNGGVDWNWDDVNSYISKAENIVPPKPENQAAFRIVNEDSFHGHEGPLKVGWSDHIYKVTENWIPTFEALGVKSIDIAGGNNHGAAIIPSTLNSETGHRSCSRSQYLKDGTTNLVILTGQHVTRILFDESKSEALVATGVEFQEAPDATPYSVWAKKEVIVSSGAVGSPKVLQLSGIGPKNVLEPLGIPTKVDLPVGYNFQDHVMVLVEYGAVEGTETWAPLCTNPDAQEAALAEWQQTGKGPLTYINEATAYINLPDTGATIDVNIEDVLNAHGDLPATVRAGYAAQYEIMKSWLAEKTQLETIMNLWGSQTTSIKFESAVQHPWARGSVFVSSANPFDMPHINPNYLGVDVDVQLITAGVNFVRKMANTAPFGDVLTDELSPGPASADLNMWLRENCGSEYHPVGSCPMLPQDKGGVVDTKLIVYGTKNVRVIDASVAPLQVSAHTMGPAYGIAEKGADLIKAAYVVKPVEPPVTNTTTSSRPPMTSTSITKATTAATDAVQTSAKAQSAASSLALSWLAVAIAALPLLV